MWTGLGLDDTPGWDFRSAVDDAPEALFFLYDAAVERSRMAIE